MNTSLVCLLVLAAADPAAPAPTVYPPVRDFESAMTLDDTPPLIVRAQSSPFFGGNGSTPPTYAPNDGTYTSPPSGSGYPGMTSPGTVSPFDSTLPPSYPAYQQPFGAGTTGDPWLGGGAMPAPNAAPYGAANSGLYTLGFNGAQPYRYGWTARYDVGILADEGTRSDAGSFGGWGIVEVDTEKELVQPIWNNYVFAIAPQFNYRSWEGPSFMGLGFNGSMYRFGLGLKLASPDYGGWNTEIGFNPAFATDFDNKDFSDAMQWDGHAVLFWRQNPQLMWAFGAAYWDRVDDIVIPNAGFVYTPNQLWEFRLVFPKPRVSLFLGTPFSVPTWLYVRGEYHVESYAAEIEPIGGPDVKVQIEDWRVLAGLRTETGAITTFAEVGWVFERDAKLDISGINGQIHSGLIGRAGLRY